MELRLGGWRVWGLGSFPETPKPLNYGIYLKLIIGTRIRLKVYSLIKGFWGLWVLEAFEQGTCVKSKAATQVILRR